MDAQQKLYDLVNGWATPVEETANLGSSAETEEESMDWKAWREEAGLGKGISSRQIFAAGRMYNDWDAESGWGDNTWKDYKDTIKELEDTKEWTPEQWF